MSFRPIEREDEKDVDVTWEDQKRINAFGRLNTRRHELTDAVARRKRELEDIEDASCEIMLLDDEEKVRYRVGEVYVDLDPDDATERLEKRQEELEALNTADEEELETVVSTMAELKVLLYGKFGKTINLEESPAE